MMRLFWEYECKCFFELPVVVLDKEITALTIKLNIKKLDWRMRSNDTFS